MIGRWAGEEKFEDGESLNHKSLAFSFIFESNSSLNNNVPIMNIFLGF